MDETIRPSKIVFSHGAGSVIDLQQGKSAIIMSPDYWLDYEEVVDWRLARNLGVRNFRKPKKRWIETSDGGRYSGVVIRRFPRYWYCPKCRKLQIRDKCRYCDEEIATVPPRVIAICEGGHIQDFPWHKWVKCKEYDHVLELCPSEGESDLEVKCPKCIEKKKPTKEEPNPGIRSMKGALWQLPSNCFGERPWLGSKVAREDCDRKLIGAMKGGSNVYFTLSSSSILIPKYSNGIYQNKIKTLDLETVKKMYDLYDEDVNNLIFLGILDKILDSYECYYNNSQLTRDDFYRAFLYHCEGNFSTKLKIDEWLAYQYGTDTENIDNDDEFYAEELIEARSNNFLKQFFDKIIILRKITETVALTGFTRVNPPVTGMPYSKNEHVLPAVNSIREDDDVNWRKIRGDMIKECYYLERVDEKGNVMREPDRTWYPGIQNKGEGIFFIFNLERLRKWEKNKHWINLVNEMRHFGTTTLSMMECFDYSPRGLLIHSFSHLLVRQIARECGYQLAALKERLYVSDDEEMYGVLIYTSSPDNQGSLGGLIHQATDISLLINHINQMQDSARICSQDPLCGHQSPDSIRKPWGAACHSCIHIPETSCEMLMNKFLDRHTVYGDGNEKIGFFEV